MPKRERKEPKMFGAPLAPNDPGFYGNGDPGVPFLPPTIDTEGRILPHDSEGASHG